MARLGQVMENLQSELQKHRVIAVEKNPRTVDSNQKVRQNITRLCNYCRTNGHTPSCCTSKMRDENLKRIGNDRTTEKKVTSTQDYNKNRGPDNGSEQCTRGQDFKRRDQNYKNDGFRKNSPLTTRVSLQGQILHMGTTVQTMEDYMINEQINY